MATLQFSDTTTKLGIIQACETNCNLGDAGISGNATLLKEFTRNVNRANSIIWSWIFSAYGGWQYDDGNQTNLPSASDTLTSSQVKYSLPTGAYTVRGVSVKDTGGVWHDLFPRTEEQIKGITAIDEFQKTPATPTYYTLKGTTISIFPAANYTQTASFKVFFDRGSVAFASTDTTATPGFIAEYHDALPIGASIPWLQIHKPGSPVLLEMKMEWDGNEAATGREGGYKKRIKSFYSQRYQEMFPPRITVNDQTQEYV